MNSILTTVYPVGAIYISVNSTNPGILFGGTWQAIEGNFLIGADSTYTAGQTGGSTNHTHTLSHTHTMAHTHTYAHTHTTPATNTGSTAITVAQMPSHDHGGKTGNDTGYNSTWALHTYIIVALQLTRVLVVGSMVLHMQPPTQMV